MGLLSWFSGSKPKAEEPQQPQTTTTTTQPEPEREPKNPFILIPPNVNDVLDTYVDPNIRATFIESVNADISQQFLRLVSDQCLNRCEVSQFDPRSKKTMHPNASLTEEQNKCMRRCGKKMMNALLIFSEKYQERVSAPGSTVYLGLNENVARSFRVNTSRY